MLSTVPQLTDLERAVLDFEAKWWRHQGSKETAIREQFDLSETRFYQRINTLIDRPEALAYAPQTVKRLARVRERVVVTARRRGVAG